MNQEASTPGQVAAIDPTKAKLKMTEKIGYAVGDTASCLYWQTFSMFLMIFYTDVFGLAPAVVGTMMGITRAWDAFVDPVIGVMADRTQTRFGKFRPWILFGAVPFAISGVLLFITPNFSPTGKLIYAYATYSLVMVIYSCVNVPYGALLGVITANPHERTKLSSYRFIGAFSGNIIVQSFLLYLIAKFGGGDSIEQQRIGYPLAMTVFAVLAAALFFYTFASTKERVLPPAEQGSVMRDAKDLLKNRPWLILCLMGLFTLLYISIRNAAMLYYFKYYMNDQGAAAAFMLIGTIFSIVGAMITPFLTKIFGGKRSTFLVLTVWCSGALFMNYFVQPVFDTEWVVNTGVLANLGLSSTITFKINWTLYASNILFSIPSAAMFPLIWSMYADTADYGVWKFNRRATGLVFSAATFSQKMGWAVGGSLAGFMLAFFGFIANQQQNSQALGGIRNMMSLIPAAVAVLAVAATFLYTLNNSTEKQMHEDLRARGQS